MTPPNSTPPDDETGAESKLGSDEQVTRPVADTLDSEDIVVDSEAEMTTSEVQLGGPILRPEPTLARKTSDDLYLRLEGRIYGPFQPDRLEMLLESGTLTGLETASIDLHHWTPLAYHPRIVRGRIRDLERVHEVLTELSTLPMVKGRDDSTKLVGPPQAAILRRRPRKTGSDANPDPADEKASELNEN